MLQQLVIRTKDKTSLKPLLESAIENQKKALKAGLARTQTRLAEFEQRFGMTSEEFERRLAARELEETFDFTDWRMEIGIRALLEKSTPRCKRRILSIEAYLQSLLAAVAASPNVHSSEVALDQRGPQAGLVRGDIYY